MSAHSSGAAEPKSTGRHSPEGSSLDERMTVRAAPAQKKSSKRTSAFPLIRRGSSSVLSAKPVFVPERPRPTEARAKRKSATEPSGTAALATPASAVSAVEAIQVYLRP
jgi:hypothetical protein